MSGLKSYEDLLVWRKGIELVKEIYQVTKLLPKDEQFGLVVQMRRSAVSIPANIAEGFARQGDKEFTRFLEISFGSGAELETHIEICKAIAYLNSEQCLKSEALLLEVMKMLNTLIKNKKASLY